MSRAAGRDTSAGRRQQFEAVGNRDIPVAIRVRHQKILHAIAVPIQDDTLLPVEGGIGADRIYRAELLAIADPRGQLRRFGIRNVGVSVTVQIDRHASRERVAAPYFPNALAIAQHDI